MTNIVEIENLEARIAVRLDQHGHEVPDPTPMALPSGFKRPETLQEQIARLVKSQVSRMAQEAGAETFEDSEDFDIGDDIDPSSPFETFFDPALNRDISPDEFARNHELYKKRYLKAQEQYFAQIDEQEIIEDNLIRKKYQEDRAKEKDKGGPEPENKQTK